jgi:hypothetical protein
MHHQDEPGELAGSRQIHFRSGSGFPAPVDKRFRLFFPGLDRQAAKRRDSPDEESELGLEELADHALLWVISTSKGPAVPVTNSNPIDQDSAEQSA